MISLAHFQLQAPNFWLPINIKHLNHVGKMQFFNAEECGALKGSFCYT
jgi:hypothetical protein